MSIEGAILSQQMEDPKSVTGIFELPCGYIDPQSNDLHTEVEIHEMTGIQEDMLASPRVKDEEKMSALLAGCITRVGSITERGKISRLVDELTTGDRVYLLFAIRRVTLGDELPVRESCPKCKASNLYIIDLSELSVDRMEDPRKRVFDATLPSGKAARFRLSIGSDEKLRSKLKVKSPKDAMSKMILMRLELLNGEPPTLTAVQTLGLRDRQFLRKQFEELEGGLDLAVDLDCPDCGHEWAKDLEMSPDFFSPSET